MKLQLFVFISILICKSFCVDLFVSQNGNDTSNCGSEQEPCATIQYAIDLYDTSNIIVNSNFTLENPLQANNKNININTTLEYNPTIDISNGFLLSSNSSLFIKNLNINANSFLIFANQTFITLMGINFGGSNFDRDLFSFTSNYTLQISGINFLDDLHIQGSFFSGQDSSLLISSITTKNIIIEGEFPFISINNGMISLDNFVLPSITLSQTPLIKVNNTGFQTLNNYAQFTIVNFTNIQNASCLMDLNDANFILDRVSFISSQTKNALFSFQSKSRTKIQIFNSVFDQIKSVPFEMDIFSKSNTDIYLLGTFFSNNDLPKNQPLFGFDNSYPINITLNTVTVSSLNGSVLSLTTTNNPKPENFLASGFHYVKLTINRFLYNQADQGAVLNIETSLIPITLISSYNQYLYNKANLNGGAIYFSSPNNLTSFRSDEDTICHNFAGLNGGALYVENTPSVTVTYARFSNNFGQNGGAFYVDNSSIVINITNYFDNRASLNGGIGYINNSDKNYLGNSNIINSTAGVSGGHIYLSQSFLSVQASTFKQGFSQNGATVYSGNNSIVLFYNSFSSYYYAIKGGICYAEKESSCFLDKFSGFIGNASYGGAVYGEANSTIDIDGTSIQTSNALYDGGAIWTEGNLRVHNSSFKFNQAQRFGGAIYIQNTMVASLVFVDLKNNDANKKASSLYLSNSKISLLNVTTSDAPYQSVFCNASTVDIKYSTFSSFGCSSCKFSGAITLCKFPTWAWVVIGVGSGLLLIVIISVSIFVPKEKIVDTKKSKIEIRNEHFSNLKKFN